MKKLSIYVVIILMILLLNGCTINNSDQDIIDDPIIDINYNQEYNMIFIKPVSLFNCIYIPDSKDLNTFLIKDTIFDLAGIDQLDTFYMNVYQSKSGYNSDFSADDLTLELYRTFSYIYKLYYVRNYKVFDFSPYFNDDFVNDIKKLDDGEMVPHEIFDKYGTHVVLSIIDGIEFEINLNADTQSLTELEFEFVINYLTEYTSEKYSSVEDDLFNNLSDKCNIKFNIKSSLENLSYLEVLNKWNTGDFEPYSTFIAPDGLLPIWWLLKDNSNAKGLLESAYESLNNDSE